MILRSEVIQYTIQYILNFIYAFLSNQNDCKIGSFEIKHFSIYFKFKLFMQEEKISR